MALPNNVVHLKPDGSKTVVDHSWTGDDRLDLLLHEAGRAKAPHRARAMRRAAKELGQAAAEGGVGFNHALGILKRLAEKNGMLEPASSWQGADSVVLARMETIAAETFLSVADAANREALKVELAWMDRSLSGTPAMCSGAQSNCGGRAIKGRSRRTFVETGDRPRRTFRETGRTIGETDARSSMSTQNA